MNKNKHFSISNSINEITKKKYDKTKQKRQTQRITETTSKTWFNGNKSNDNN